MFVETLNNVAHHQAHQMKSLSTPWGLLYCCGWIELNIGQCLRMGVFYALIVQEGGGRREEGVPVTSNDT